jgi:hypothetical protein
VFCRLIQSTCHRWIRLLVAVLGGISGFQSTQSAEQGLELAPGWNLVSLQVAGPEVDGAWTIG